MTAIPLSYGVFGLRRKKGIATIFHDRAEEKSYEKFAESKTASRTLSYYPGALTTAVILHLLHRGHKDFTVLVIIS